jgi:hypothetical protein
MLGAMLGSSDTPSLAGDRDHHLFWLVRLRGTENRHKAIQKSHKDPIFAMTHSYSGVHRSG